MTRYLSMTCFGGARDRGSPDFRAIVIALETGALDECVAA